MAYYRKKVTRRKGYPRRKSYAKSTYKSRGRRKSSVGLNRRCGFRM